GSPAKLPLVSGDEPVSARPRLPIGLDGVEVIRVAGAARRDLPPSASVHVLDPDAGQRCVIADQLAVGRPAGVIGERTGGIDATQPAAVGANHEQAIPPEGGM